MKNLFLVKPSFLISSFFKCDPFREIRHDSILSKVCYAWIFIFSAFIFSICVVGGIFYRIILNVLLPTALSIVGIIK